MELPLPLHGISAAQHDSHGNWIIELDTPNQLDTACGPLVPRYSLPDERRRARYPLTLYPNGTPKRVSLEQQTMVRTPLGSFPAELLTFYPNGSLKRLFPLDGQLSGFWSEADEGQLQSSVEVPVPWGTVRAKLVGLCFHPDGALRSLTLWPGEKATVPTPVGPVVTRIGFTLRRDGSVESVEPARPVQIPLPQGTLSAYDAMAVGVQAEDASLRFGPDGHVRAFYLTGMTLCAYGEDGTVIRVHPAAAEATHAAEEENLEDADWLEEGPPMLLPLRLEWMNDRITVSNGDTTVAFDAQHTRFVAENLCNGASCGSCAGCSGCR